MALDHESCDSALCQNRTGRDTLHAGATQRPNFASMF